MRYLLWLIEVEGSFSSASNRLWLSTSLIFRWLPFFAQAAQKLRPFTSGSRDSWLWVRLGVGGKPSSSSSVDLPKWICRMDSSNFELKVLFALKAAPLVFAACFIVRIRSRTVGLHSMPSSITAAHEQINPAWAPRLRHLSPRPAKRIGENTRRKNGRHSGLFRRGKSSFVMAQSNSSESQRLYNGSKNEGGYRRRRWERLAVSQTCSNLNWVWIVDSASNSCKLDIHLST